MKKKLLCNKSWLACIATTLLSFSFAGYAQKPSKVQFTLNPPELLEPIEVTANSFIAHWRNVPIQWDPATDPITFKILTTREIKAEKDGVYKIAAPTIKGDASKVGKAFAENSLTKAWLDDAFSQPNWMGGNCYFGTHGVVIDTKEIDAQVPNNMIEGLARIQSPQMDLSNNHGEFTVEFKLRNTSNKEASLTFFTYGDDFQAPGMPIDAKSIKQLAVEPDGQLHTYKYNMSKGTFCQIMVLALKARGSVEVESFEVTQNLKKGDVAYRGTGFVSVDYLATEHDENSLDNPHQMKYRFNLKENLNPIALDNEKAKAEGERNAYRMSLSRRTETYTQFRFERSFISDPIYLDGNNSVPVDDKYFYVGYTNKVTPFFDRSFPSNTNKEMTEVAAAAIYNGAMLKEYVGQEIVGIRVALAASRQPNYVIEPIGWKPEVPFIFISHQLRTYDNEGTLRETVYDVKTSTDTLYNGWNTIFFNKPYTIREYDDFAAGIHLMDNKEGYCFLLNPNSSSKTNNPKVCYYAVNFANSNSSEVRFMPLDKKDCYPLLMQLIIRPKEVTPEQANRGELSIIEAKDIYYKPNWPASIDVTINNIGTKPIEKASFEVAFGEYKINKDIKLSTPIGGGTSNKVTINDLDITSLQGEVNLTVTLKGVNDVTSAKPSALSQPTRIVDIADVYPRTSVIEISESENCPYCALETETFYKDFRDGKDGKLSDELEAIRKRTIVVMHHPVFGSADFLTTDYSNRMNDFYSGKSFYPALALDRTANKHLKHSPDKGPLVLGKILGGINYKTAVDYSLFMNPAYGMITLTKEYDATKKQVTVKVDGKVSKAIDSKRDLYVTFLVTQDKIKSRNQASDDKKRTPDSFTHRNALRYASEPIKLTSIIDGKFELIQVIPIDAVAAGENPKDNQFLLESNGEDVTHEQLLENLEFIAVLHYNANIKESKKNIFLNEIVNAASDKVTPPTEVIPGYTLSTKQVVEQGKIVVYNINGTIYCSDPYATLEVYNISGQRVQNHGLMTGVYIVRATEACGKTTIAKVVVRG